MEGLCEALGSNPSSTEERVVTFKFSLRWKASCFDLQPVPCHTVSGILIGDAGEVWMRVMSGSHTPHWTAYYNPRWSMWSLREAKCPLGWLGSFGVFLNLLIPLSGSVLGEKRQLNCARWCRLGISAPQKAGSGTVSQANLNYRGSSRVT